MTARLGILISPSVVRGILLRRGRVVWNAEHSVDGEDIETAVSLLLEQAPIPRIDKPRAFIAVGLAYSQLKPIDGLPSTASFTVLNRVVRENAESFFLATGRRLIVTNVDRRGDGTVWAAAFSPQVIDGAVAALKRLGITAITAVPFVVAFSSIVPAGTYRVADGAIAAELTTDGARIMNLRRIVPPSVSTTVTVPAAIAGIGPRAVDYLSAFGATTASRGAAFTWRPERSARHSRTIARIRVGVTAMLLTSSLAGALVAPGARVTRAARVASRELAGMRAERAAATGVDADLRRVTLDLEQIERFTAARGAMTLLLGEIARAMPESTALLNIRIDSVEGSFIALSPHAAAILPQLAEIQGVTAPRIVGSIARETQGAARLERATFRFSRLRPDAK